MKHSPAFFEETQKLLYATVNTIQDPDISPYQRATAGTTRNNTAVPVTAYHWVVWAVEPGVKSLHYAEFIPGISLSYQHC
jgi:hypothetical protein